MHLFKPTLFPMLALIGLVLAPLHVHAGSRLKDIVEVEGVRENQLIGYGLVVGLNGTGDNLNNCPSTRQSVESMLERLGNNTRNLTMKTKNIAGVMVTANLPPFSTSGSRMDVTISAMCDAPSLEGGTLLATPLLGADGQVYVVSQGTVAIGGFAAGGDSGSAVTRNIPTSGRIPNGGLIERELPFALAEQKSLRLSLRNPDMTTAHRVSGVINTFLGANAARALDPATVTLRRPNNFPGDMASLLAAVERLEVEPDQSARIIINETTGIIVMGENVRVSTVAIAQGNLTISVQETPAVSQPNAIAEGETVVVPQTDITVAEDVADLAVIEGGVPLQDLVNGLNALGVSPRDMISILQALKASGALQADIEVM